MRFKTVVLQPRPNVTGIEIPADIIEKLAAGKKPPVAVTIGEYTYRTTVGVMGGKSMVPLSAENRKAAGVEGGEAVTVNIELDSELRVTDVPSDFAEAMNEAPGTREFFDSLAASYQKEWVRWIEEAKKEETRLARLAKAIEGLSAGKKTH